ncbi:Acetyl-CoA carboxylase, carboxyltransferase component [Desulfatibacillum alkenivorans DSM 16219]|jgi:propionyl-CoA carboxylase beta chain|uniref:Acetyl-CoA carboxylase, carboxyltransferase component n=1 Tax=Desulfatibacillum alkenivorans DSM 16219 TaxID=1121393 RepID=A0A1M6N8Q6_9BACT|nr:carboxyl transferase domain-containing protein [Desulfatibacillum alkenivorans]SHJ92072.1 Acetyl-CoA carboxylase, carboxyltransferase component [Desulfatibacillum alkenivorans DSM 16219]
MGATMDAAIQKYLDIQEKNKLGGGQEHIDRQHKRGKLTARERIDILVDPNSFKEVGTCVNTTGVRIDGRKSDAPCDGVLFGTARIHGRTVMVHSADFTVLGGSGGTQTLMKLARGNELAIQWGLPMIHLMDSSGGRLGYQDVPFAGIDWYFRTQSRYSGVIPQITVLMGPCIAGGAYLPTLCDLLLMSRVSGTLWLGGPRQTQAATSEVYDENVGGADYHMQYTGTCDAVGNDDKETLLMCRDMLRYLPSNYRHKPPMWEKTDDPHRETPELTNIVPDDFSQTYDMHDVIKAIVDEGEYFEIKDEYAKNLTCCFCRFDGRSVGLVANNPKYPGSALDVDACDKYYRFLQLLDAYSIPLVNLVDTPPVVPGEDEEVRGVLRHIGKVLDVYATATIPKIGVVLRQSYADAGSLFMSGLKGMGADITYAWPIAQFAVEASTMDYKEVLGDCIEEDVRETFWKYSREKVDAFDTAMSWSNQMVDEIILPKDTRKMIIEALTITEDKEETLPERRKRHGSAPS